MRLGLRKEKDPKVIERYRVQLVRYGVEDSTTVTVWNIQDQPAAAGEGILTLLFEKLKNGQSMIQLEPALPDVPCPSRRRFHS